MTQVLEAKITDQVARAAIEMGYKVSIDPTRIPSRNSWQDSLISIFHSHSHRPDILVEHGENFLIIDIKRGPVLLGSVIQARKYADYVDAEVILCFPDNSSPKIPRSVREFAEEQRVRLCSLSEVCKALKQAFSSPHARRNTRHKRVS